MGRMKWFQLDSDMPQDPKIRAVIRALGPAGVGGLVGVWCHVARHGNYPGRAVDREYQPLPLDDIADASLLPREQFQQLLEICLGTGHFQREAWQRCRGIWIPAMERRGDTYAKRHLTLKQPHLGFE
jgi:hypothetical protein